MKSGKQVNATGRDGLLIHPVMVTVWALLLPVFVWPSSADEPTVSGAMRADAWDVASDTWVATDALGRRVPTHEEVGAPRADRTVGVFYFLWHGSHVQGGPYDVTKILIEDPQAMEKPDSPLWGPLLAPHHWVNRFLGTI